MLTTISNIPWWGLWIILSSFIFVVGSFLYVTDRLRFDRDEYIAAAVFSLIIPFIGMGYGIAAILQIWKKHYIIQRDKQREKEKQLEQDYQDVIKLISD